MEAFLVFGVRNQALDISLKQAKLNTSHADETTDA